MSSQGLPAEDQLLLAKYEEYRSMWSTDPSDRIWAAVADAHVQSADVAAAPIEFSRDGADFSVEVGDFLSMDANGTVGFNEDLGTISPHPLTSDFEMHTGKSTTATVSYDDQFDWDVSGNNAYLGDFELASA